MTSVLPQVTAIATIIIALALVVLSCLAVVIAWRVRGIEQRVTTLLDRHRDDVGRIVQNTSRASEHVARLTSTAQAQVDRMSETLDTIRDGVERTVARTEHQLTELDALVTVVREEAEALFMSTASTVRAVRRGAGALERFGGTNLASDEPDAAAPADDTMTLEERDGDDSDSESAAQALPAAPRIRPRRAGSRRA